MLAPDEAGRCRDPLRAVAHGRSHVERLQRHDGARGLADAGGARRRRHGDPRRWGDGRRGRRAAPLHRRIRRGDRYADRALPDVQALPEAGAGMEAGTGLPNCPPFIPVDVDGRPTTLGAANDTVPADWSADGGGHVCRRRRGLRNLPVVHVAGRGTKCLTVSDGLSSPTLPDLPPCNWPCRCGRGHVGPQYRTALDTTSASRSINASCGRAVCPMARFGHGLLFGDAYRQAIPMLSDPQGQRAFRVPWETGWSLTAARARG